LGRHIGSILVSKTKYVSFGESGIWAYDVGLGVFLKYLIDAAEECPPDADAAWLTPGVSSWRVAAAVPDCGVDLDAGWNPTQISLFKRLVDKACSTLQGREAIPRFEIEHWNVLDDLHLYTRGDSEVLTAPIVELGRAIGQLISGSLPADPADCAGWPRTLLPSATS
jgi:hypothetical protein